MVVFERLVVDGGAALSPVHVHNRISLIWIFLLHGKISNMAESMWSFLILETILIDIKKMNGFYEREPFIYPDGINTRFSQ